MGIEPGTWVAISFDQERVVATGSTVEETLKQARAAGEQQPFIVRVPIEYGALIL